MPDQLHRGAANKAGGLIATIDKITLLKVAGLAVAVDEVAQCAATGGDGLHQGVFYRFDQAVTAREREFACGKARVDAGVKKRFIGVDIANADYKFGLHQ